MLEDLGNERLSCLGFKFKVQGFGCRVEGLGLGDWSSRLRAALECLRSVFFKGLYKGVAGLSDCTWVVFQAEVLC